MDIRGSDELIQKNVVFRRQDHRDARIVPFVPHGTVPHPDPGDVRDFVEGTAGQFSDVYAVFLDAFLLVHVFLPER